MTGVVLAMLWWPLGPGARAYAGGGPENVAVVVNGDSWASQAVANEFIRLRNIPPRNVIYLDKVPDLDQVTIEVFRESILKPVLAELAARKLTGQIDYVVYSSDLPWNIDLREEIKAADLSGVPQPLAKVLTPEGSVNGLTFLYSLVLAKDVHYLDLQANGYYRRAERSGEKLSLQRPVGFRADRSWGREGQIAPQGQGSRYLLSTMLAVTGGRGNSLREALGYLQRSASADGTRPRGTVYLMSSNDVRSRVRQALFPAAVEALASLGVAARIDPGVLPQGRDDVAGLLTGTDNFNWASCKSRILPGAICENFTSWGGVMTEGAKQTPLTEFLRHGAAGSSGTVMEPYATAAKFPTAFLHVHYASGCSLAEAFYQAVAGPYQLLIVGDPLCQPWARFPKVQAEALAGGQPVKPGQEVSGKLAIRPAATEAEVGRFELFVDGVRRSTCPPGQEMELDSAELADGYHELRVVGIAKNEIETQGRAVLPLNVNNHGLKLTVEAPTAKAITWDQPLELRASAKGAKRIEFLHNARPVGTIQGEQGAARISPRLLGQGLVRLLPVAVVAGPGGAETTVNGEPVELEIRPPIPMTPPAGPPAAPPARGVLLVTADGRKWVVEKYSRNWLRDLGVQADQTVELRACFQVPDHDTYQFQINSGKGTVTMAIDGQAVEVPQRRPWKFVPVSLAAGLHHVRLVLKTDSDRRVEIRFGGMGTRNVLHVFQHVPEAGERPAGPAGAKP